MLHGWLNTGHQRIKIEPGADDTCPSCGMADKTQDHIIRCLHRSMKAQRYQALQKLKSAITLTKGSSYTLTALFSSISQWVEGNDTPTLDLTDRHMSFQMKSVLQRAYRTQKSIGWNLLLRGYMCGAWSEAQQIEWPQATSTGIRSQWTYHVILAIRQFSLAMWEKRNEKLHQKQAPSEQIVTSSLCAMVTRLYQQQYDFASMDQLLFEMPMAERLRLPLSAIKNWVCLALYYQKTTRKRKKGINLQSQNSSSACLRQTIPFEMLTFNC